MKKAFCDACIHNSWVFHSDTYFQLPSGNLLFGFTHIMIKID